MKSLGSSYFLILTIFCFFYLSAIADENELESNKKIKKNKIEQKKDGKYKERFERISEERKDHILSEFDSNGDGELNDDERAVLRQRMEKYRKNK